MAKKLRSDVKAVVLNFFGKGSQIHT